MKNVEAIAHPYKHRQRGCAHHCPKVLKKVSQLLASLSQVRVSINVHSLNKFAITVIRTLSLGTDDTDFVPSLLKRLGFMQHSSIPRERIVLDDHQYAAGS